ncbi:glycine betaine/proline transport system permease protein [Amycolatopsis sulphurea]|uniref:Glycine betaine/proline transport system permease protein n=1 Tax=Amycolatopsis sulphurea TaxID=76022 RepID=A0A2A9F8G0_9PSEU|nr:proline/glycine betaine ABC transporter permease [Amycolatopsis sulphurea]PFG46832.1 glycine betaine/proline transport system permease protein [Amycolatopsis sulphurea]
MRELFLADGWHVPRIPVGDWFASIVDWLTNNIGPFFDFVDTVVKGAVNGLASGLTWLPSLVLVVIFAALGWWARGWRFGAGSLIGFALVDGLGELHSAMETLAQVLVAGVVAVLIAVPTGIAAARNASVSRVVKPVLDFMQTLPSFVYLIPVVVFFSIGPVPGVVATVVFALPPGVRLTELGIRQVDPEMVEAGEAFGSPPRRILTEIQIPLAMPSIMAGINQIIMLSLSMVVISGMVGAPGLGAEVYAAVTSLKIGQGFEAGIGVVVLAIYLDRLTSTLGARSAVGRARRRTAAA